MIVDGLGMLNDSQLRAGQATLGKRGVCLSTSARRGAGAAASPTSLPDPARRAGAGGEAAAAADHWVLDLRSGSEVRRLMDDPRLGALAARGVSTPDHVIRIKAGPVILPAADAMDWAAGAQAAVSGFGDAYAAYFERQAVRFGGAKRRLDPLPRLAAIPGLGLVGIGRTAAEAAVAADLGEAWAATVLRAEAVGRFEPVGEADLFDMEYWSLEQAKLGKARPARLAGRVVVVTGAGGAIGAATAAAFAAEGAEVALLDLDRAAAERAAGVCGRHALALGCDVTDPASVTAAFAAVSARFGGVDMAVSNAGAAVTGAMADLPEAELRPLVRTQLLRPPARGAGGGGGAAAPGAGGSPAVQRL